MYREKDRLAIEVGNKVKSIRQKLSQSQDEFAYFSDSDRTYICKIENGTQNLTIKKLCEICESCDITLKEFFSDVAFDKYFYKEQDDHE